MLCRWTGSELAQWGNAGKQGTGSVRSRWRRSSGCHCRFSAVSQRSAGLAGGKKCSCAWLCGESRPGSRLGCWVGRQDVFCWGMACSFHGVPGVSQLSPGIFGGWHFPWPMGGVSLPPISNYPCNDRLTHLEMCGAAGLGEVYLSFLKLNSPKKQEKKIHHLPQPWCKQGALCAAAATTLLWIPLVGVRSEHGNCACPQLHPERVADIAPLATAPRRVPAADTPQRCPELSHQAPADRTCLQLL